MPQNFKKLYKEQLEHIRMLEAQRFNPYTKVSIMKLIKSNKILLETNKKFHR